MNQTDKLVNDAAICKMIVNFEDTWVPGYIEENDTPPINWELGLAIHLLNQYNTYASDKAVIKFEKK